MKKRQSVVEWLVRWVDSQYPDREFSRPDARIRSFNDLPRGYLPSIDKLIWNWWVEQFNKSLTANAFGFPDGNRGKTVVRQEELPWDDFSRVMIGKLQMVKADREAVRCDVQAWAKVNQPGLDIDITMQHLLKAAGF